MNPVVVGHVNRRGKIEYTADAETLKAINGRVVVQAGKEIWAPFDTNDEALSFAKKRSSATAIMTQR